MGHILGLAKVFFFFFYPFSIYSLIYNFFKLYLRGDIFYALVFPILALEELLFDVVANIFLANYLSFIVTLWLRKFIEVLF